jgi:hypothetical protein
MGRGEDWRRRLAATEALLSDAPDATGTVRWVAADRRKCSEI